MCINIRASRISSSARIDGIILRIAHHTDLEGRPLFGHKNELSAKSRVRSLRSTPPPQPPAVQSRQPVSRSIGGGVTQGILRAPTQHGGGDGVHILPFHIDFHQPPPARPCGACARTHVLRSLCQCGICGITLSRAPSSARHGACMRTETFWILFTPVGQRQCGAAANVIFIGSFGLCGMLIVRNWPTLPPGHLR